MIGGTKTRLKAEIRAIFVKNMCSWNPNDPCFAWKRPCFGGLTFKNRGYLGSRLLYIYFLKFVDVIISFIDMSFFHFSDVFSCLLCVCFLLHDYF